MFCRRQPPQRGHSLNWLEWGAEPAVEAPPEEGEDRRGERQLEGDGEGVTEAVVELAAVAEGALCGCPGIALLPYDLVRHGSVSTGRQAARAADCL